MTTSGTVIISSNQEKIIKGAARLLELYEIGDTLPVGMYNNMAESLNEMMLEWQTEKVGLWLEDEVTLLTQKAAQSYDLGPSGDHATLSRSATELSADASSGDGTIDVDDITGILDGDNISIELDTGYAQFTTVNGTPAGDTVTLTDVLTGDASEDNAVAFYTDKIDRPLNIRCVRYKYASGNEQPFTMWPRARFFKINVRTQESTPSIGYYQSRTTNSRLYIWPTCNNVDGQIVFTAQMPIEIFVNRGDSPDLPEEWLSALKYNLADDYGPEMWSKINRDKYLNVLVPKAKLKFEKLQRWDREKRSIIFRPKKRELYYDRA